MKKNKIPPSKPTEQHPHEKLPWSVLNDKQKAQLLLGSSRMLDDVTFIQEFESWETPETTFSTKNKKS